MMSLLVGSWTLLTYTHQFFMQNSFSEWSSKHHSNAPLNTCLNLLVAWSSLQSFKFSTANIPTEENLFRTTVIQTINSFLAIYQKQQNPSPCCNQQFQNTKHNEFKLRVFVASNKYSGFLHTQVRFQRLEILTCSLLCGPVISEMQLYTKPCFNIPNFKIQDKLRAKFCNLIYCAGLICTGLICIQKKIIISKSGNHYINILTNLKVMSKNCIF